MATMNNDEHESVVSIDDEYRRLNNVDSYDTLTESLGFESLTLNSKCDFDEEWLLTGERRSPSNTKAASKEKTKCTIAVNRDFPPVISTLNKNGRTRFNLEKVREYRRLQISCVKNTRPEVFIERTPADADDEENGGRVRIKFIDDSSGTEQ
ncbi:putative germin-like protein subfamily 1 member 20-like [Capsicum annuum]|nr:putative germin-like protein subfamily 1 member 20-like [Capsicum annuum]